METKRYFIQVTGPHGEWSADVRAQNVYGCFRQIPITDSKTGSPFTIRISEVRENASKNTETNAGVETNARVETNAGVPNENVS